MWISGLIDLSWRPDSDDGNTSYRIMIPVPLGRSSVWDPYGRIPHHRLSGRASRSRSLQIARGGHRASSGARSPSPSRTRAQPPLLLIFLQFTRRSFLFQFFTTTCVSSALPFSPSPSRCSPPLAPSSTSERRSPSRTAKMHRRSTPSSHR